jgi:hypothetical protein
MTRREQGRASHGSRRWLQILVNECPEVIDRVLANLLGLAQGEQVHWLSPLKDDDYAEYRDQEFITRLGITLERVPLVSFWPRLGPAWDALAKTDRGNLILVEAKAHISELVSDPTGASGSSLAKIQESLDATKRFLGSRSDADWATCFYQYTNRLAHLYLLRELNALPAYLLFLYFINDEEMGGPGTQLEWEGAIYLLESFLRIRRPHRLAKYVLHAFIDVEELGSATT